MSIVPLTKTEHEWRVLNPLIARFVRAMAVGFAFKGVFRPDSQAVARRKYR